MCRVYFDMPILSGVYGDYLRDTRTPEAWGRVPSGFAMTNGLAEERSQ